MKMTLRIKLFLFIGLLLIIQAVAVSMFIIITMANNELEARTRFVGTISQVISSDIELMVADGNVGELITQFTSLSLALSTRVGDENRSDVRFVAAFKGGILFDGIRKENLSAYEGLYFPSTRKIEDRRTADTIIISNPLYYNGKRIGSLVLGYSLDAYNRSITSNITVVVVFGTFFLLLALGASLIFINSIVKAVNILKKYAQKISDGDLSLEAVSSRSKDEVGSLFDSFNSMSHSLKSIIAKVKDITVNLISSSKEIEAAAQEQTTASNEHASGITEVSATLQELSITAKQITSNAGELVVASEEAIKLLKTGEQALLSTVELLEEVGLISRANTHKIGDLGKKSELISEMVEIIKDISNKTNMLSINASIEASRAGEAGKGFSVVAAEIRELSKETISSAKKVGEAGKEIQNLLDSIIVSAESESNKVTGCGKIVKTLSNDLENIIKTVNGNYNFTQKIDISIKQQGIGSKQAAETMKQMAEIAQQSAETARQTLLAVKNIVGYSSDLSGAVEKFIIEKTANG